MRKLNDAPARSGGQYVLYWCRWNRRAESNHALAFASLLANRLGVPLLFFENLSCSDPCDNLRMHTFVLEGIPETEANVRGLGIGYVFHLARRKDERVPLPALLREAAAFVTDDYPFALSARPYNELPETLDVQSYAVESSCVVPPACIGQRSYAAYSIRPKIHKLLPQYLKPVPSVNVEHRFPIGATALHTEVRKQQIPALAASCEIDCGVPPSTSIRGGRAEANRRLKRFLHHRLRRYAREKNEPAAHATSGLSPHLHFGQISSLEVALAAQRCAQEHKLVADEFLEELIVRRELAFNFAWHSRRVDNLDELPDWARDTLRAHRKDKRDPVYTREQFESGATADALWNATQKELLLRGVIHGYYRMYWGKKILEWSATPREALATMIHLHDRYALDGRDPNTYANILWCFGLHDRPWPERPVYGTVRSMSLAGMERKTDVAAYIKEIEFLERTGKELTT
ncbi:MAG TPA: deoxyribodipyrimidine photo-lyase [Candidatus Sulfopaludibacter sp.]|nr:deoxyribodipyrimidine photo-lyase [Candidatus Sulfopaludibacter sp.]